VFIPNIYAQNTTIDEAKVAIEKYIENTESTADYTDLYDQIEFLIKNPINLNNADADRLSKIPFITPQKITIILTHIRLYGKLKALQELQTLDGFTLEYIKLILPFITVQESFKLTSFTENNFWTNATHEIILLGAQRQEQAVGYTLADSNKNAYLGSPQRMAIRYRGNINENLQLNINSEKDAGEQLKTNTIFYSGNIIFKGNVKSNAKIKIKFLALGDFQAAFGQGLTFGSGLAFGKSPFVLNIMRTQNGLRSYRAFNENEFLRGIGTTFGIGKNLEFTAFYSAKKIDATAESDSNISDGFSSIINTGYQRSANELSKKEFIKREIIGSHLQAKFSTFNIGFTAVQTQYNQPINPSNPNTYQLYNFKGNKALNVGSDYKWYIKNMLLFGEISSNHNLNQFSFINGAIIALSKDIDISLLYRNYSPKATPIITNAIGEASDNKNENGLYIGASFTPYKNYKLNAYFDIYKFHWLRYQRDAPSAGKDMMAELQYAKRKSYNWYLRYRNEQKLKNQTEIQTINPLENNTRQLLRFHIDYILSPTLSFSNRVEQSWYSLQFGKTTTGILLFHDMEWKPKPRFSLIARIMYFDIQNYNSRLYAYENDMLYSFTVPAFQNKGTRTFFLCKYKMAKGLDIWLRWARTSYENVNTISSAQDLIKGNKATDIKCQVRWVF